MSGARRRGAHALDPRLPPVPSVLKALEALAEGAAPDADGDQLRLRLLSSTYRLLFAQLAAAVGVEVTTEQALAGLPALDPPRAEAARNCLETDPGWRGAGVGALGRVHEELLGWRPVVVDGRWTWRREGRLRKASGAYFTPAPLVEHLLDEALDPVLAGTGDPTAVRVLDPACGAGAFLVPAARRLARLHTAGGDPGEAWRRATASVRGVDLDAAVLELARVCLWLDPLARSEQPSSWTARRLMVEVDLVEADAVACPAVAADEHVDVVVGNPPFANQLERLTARDAAATRRLRSTAADVAAYTDLSAVFLLRALSWVGPGGRIGLVQPSSVLSARDASPIRRAVAEAGALRSVWAAGSGVFDAAVPACALVVEVGGRQGAIRRWHGAGIAPGEPFAVAGGGLGAEWGPLLADGLGIPAVRLSDRARLGDLAECTADFRDQYYGLAPYVREASSPGKPVVGELPLVTSGLIDPAACHWGRRGTRFLKQAWRAPVVDGAALDEDPKLGPWARRRLVPKVLVATQGKVLEAVADPDGRLLPSVPVVTARPRDPADAWRVLAVLLAPPVCAHAAARYAGSALNPDAVKLSARQVAALPLPVDHEAWQRGADGVRAAQQAADPDARRHLLVHAGRDLCTAYGLDDGDAGAVLSWWSARLP